MTDKPFAVALTGMPGARKTDFAVMLAAMAGVTVRRLSESIEREILAAGGLPTPKSFADMAATMRNQRGGGALVVEAMAEGPQRPFILLDGLRTREELSTVQAISMKSLIIAIHAPRARRFARMRQNSGPELQAEDDLLAQDEENLRLGVGDLIALADVVIGGDVGDRDLGVVVRTLLERIRSEFGIEI